MSFDTSKPADTDRISNYPANERTLRAFLETMWGVNHVNTPGATQGMHTLLQALNAETPSPIAGGIFYAKEVSGVSEAFFMDSDGNEIQLTAGGGLEINIQTQELLALSLTSNSWFRGRALDLVPVAGVVTIDWSAATLYRLTVGQDLTVNLINMPDTSLEQEQTILFELVNAGAHSLTLASGFTLQWKGGSGPTFTTSGKDLVVATSHDGSTIQLAASLDFG